MNVKMLNLVTASALLFAALYPLSSPAAGKGEKCPDWRPLSAAEKKTFTDVIHAVRSAMPQAPEGWTVQLQDDAGKYPSSICGTSGFPLSFTAQANFTNERGILESIRKFERSKSSAKIDRLSDELIDAAERGDSKKLQKLQDEMDGLSAAPAGRLTARVLVRINPSGSAGNVRGGSEISLPGAKFAYLVEDKKSKKVVIYLGRWNRRGEFAIYPDIALDRSNVSVQLMEVIIEGDIAERLAGAMNLKGLLALMQ